MKEVLKGSSLEKSVLTFFYRCWGRQTPVFPGPLPVSIERKHFKILRDNKYMVCEKTDGVRMVMVCLEVEGDPVVVIINRALQMWRVNLRVPKKAYQGTLVDGEMINNKLLVYDAVVINGENISQLDFLKRREYFSKFCKSIVKVATDTISVNSKKFENLENIEEYCTNEIPKLPHNSDGLIFTPVNSPIQLGTHETMFKWKPIEHITIDFQVKRQHNNTWGLYIQEKGKLMYEAELPGYIPLSEDMIVECRYMGESLWEPIQERTDKNYPNNRRTFYRTLVNIQENIGIKEFFNIYK